MTGKTDRFIAAMYVVGFGWTGSGPVAATLVTDDYLQEEDSPAEEDDFDALMATSSFGSEQARAIREQTPTAAREHARRVLDGKEKCAPADGDVDDAVGGLVYGLAHGVVPGPTVLILAGSALTPADLLTAVSGPQVASKLVILTVCQTQRAVARSPCPPAASADRPRRVRQLASRRGLEDHRLDLRCAPAAPRTA